MTLIAEHEVVLSDCGPFCRLAEAGEAHLDVAAEYLRPRVQVVLDVKRELRRRASFAKHQRLSRLEVLGVPERETIAITEAAMLARIDEIVDGRRRRKPGHEDEDRGEVATALVAASLGVPALMDDGWGKGFAAREGVQVFTTQDLAVELAATRTLGILHAYGIYRIVYKGASRQGFDDRVQELRRQHGL